MLGVNDGPHPGPMRERDDFRKPTSRLAALLREQGRVNVYIQTKKESAKDHSMRYCEQTLSGTRRHHPYLQQSGGRVSKMARTTPRRMGRPTLVGRVMATDSFKPCRIVSSQISRTDISECRRTRRSVKTEHLVECTERDTDAHFSRVSHM